MFGRAAAGIKNGSELDQLFIDFTQQIFAQCLLYACCFLGTK